MPEPRTVAVFVGTRADLGPLTPVIGVLAQAPEVDLHLLTGVMYDAAELEQALPEATGSGARVHALAEPMGEMSTAAQLEQGALLSAAAGRVLAEIGADSIVVLGDRWELLYVVPPAFLLGVPIVHLHGGEVTEGAVDERIRHAVTKLGDEHCVASPDAAQRLAQMGEPEERIHVTGAPGLDRLAAAQPLDDAALAGLLGVERVERPVALFTYHPPTANAEAPVGDWAVAAAEGTLAACGTVIGTHPGMDEGRDEIIAALSALAAREPRFRFVDAIGAQYPAVLAAVDVVVGNSSSGVIEAATLHLPAVDVGERQRGRLRGDNVIQAADDRADVERAVRSALSPESLARARLVVNPYGSGDASGRILDIVRRAGGAGRVKSFVDAAANGRPDDSVQDRTPGEEVAP
ncbi:UDP-N-acetylglucosamine 2-epimerase [Intrasporangium calvum]|uniref:UDP-N-acetylglucosamine 2-epimerase n=1 Tax=Intrasporangium calvum TaxID=53358 RepID=UPI000DF6360B|nr:UDP-N-acetylglucosamine 2-epimerase [Intrasporangium calvum]AXG12897.1 UDP-N-acetylglucosamine 2-epimerase (hydrolyzing) [Intrasporangium calvum]